jgi:hypothetical protein
VAVDGRPHRRQVQTEIRPQRHVDHVQARHARDQRVHREGRRGQQHAGARPRQTQVDQLNQLVRTVAQQQSATWRHAGLAGQRLRQFGRVRQRVAVQFHATQAGQPFFLELARPRVGILHGVELEQARRRRHVIGTQRANFRPQQGVDARGR